MIRFEIKKIFCRKSGKVVLLALAVLLAVSCYMPIHDTRYVNEQGETERGLGAARKLREAKKEWSGLVTEEQVKRVLRENRRINQTAEARSEEVKKQDIAYSWKQGFSDIREMINSAFGDFQEYDYFKADSVTETEVGDFYSNRPAKLKEWLETDQMARGEFSEEEKAYLLRQYEKLETPFYYEDSDGWQHLFEWAPTVIMITVLILGFLTAGIFSSEFQLKSDAIFFSSYYGRDKAVRSKIAAGLLTVTAIYWTMLLLYTAVVLGALGAGGADCPVQSAGMSSWKIFYNITFLEEYLLVTAGGYVGCLFMILVTMLVSTKTRSAVAAVMVPFLLIFLPAFLSGVVTNRVLGLLPDRLLQINLALHYFNVYRLGSRVIPAIPILFVTYGVAAAILIPMLYHSYRKAKVW